MILIVGLGNPGKKFTKTRHNLGFAILDLFQQENDFSSWQEKSKLLSQVSQGMVNNKKIVLAKPQTYINSSGKAVKNLMNFYNISPNDLWIIQDELDLDFGKVKISENRGHGGHNGIKSIINHIKTKDFTRFRIGIKPTKQLLAQDWPKFVLKRFNLKEKTELGRIKKRAIKALEQKLA